MKCGFAAIVGRPSAGKSTLINRICGERVAITSHVPQTTRNAIRGIVNRPEGQIVFLDTPGYHDSERKFNIYLRDVVHRAIADADVVLYVVDGTRAPGREESAVMQLLSRSGKPVIAALNKIDRPTPLRTEIRGLVRANLHPSDLIDVSALDGTNIEPLVEAVLGACPEGELQYPPDIYTDQNPEFRIAEIIREQAIARCDKEVPHALYVEIADMEFQSPDKPGEGKKTDPASDTDILHTSPASEDSAPEDVDPDTVPAGAPPGFFDVEPERDDGRERRTLWVRAFLVVERASQVGILVGHKGEKIKAIRIGSLKAMKRVFPWRMRLDIRVKVNPKWRSRDPLLKRIFGMNGMR